MTSRPAFSAQTLSVLAALCEQPSGWQHGLTSAGLASATGALASAAEVAAAKTAARKLRAGTRPAPAGRGAVARSTP